MADIVTRRPLLPPGRVVANSVVTLGDLLSEIEPVGTVVGARYHNVVAGLLLSKPTISVGYSLKHDALMADMGVPEFALAARAVSAPELMELFTELQSRLREVHAVIETNRELRQKELEEQFEDLAALLGRGNGSRPGHHMDLRSAERSVAT